MMKGGGWRKLLSDGCCVLYDVFAGSSFFKILIKLEK
jgi:hypothetical protein